MARGKAESEANVRGQAAVAAFQSGDFEEAARRWGLLVEEYPDNVVLRVNLGLAFFRLDDVHRAEVQFRAAVTREAAHQRAWGYLGLVLWRQGRYQEAEQAFVEGKLESMLERLQRAADDSVAHVSEAPQPYARDETAPLQGEPHPEAVPHSDDSMMAEAEDAERPTPYLPSKQPVEADGLVSTDNQVKERPAVANTSSKLVDDGQKRGEASVVAEGLEDLQRSVETEPKGLSHAQVEGVDFSIDATSGRMHLVVDADHSFCCRLGYWRVLSGRDIDPQPVLATWYEADAARVAGLAPGTGASRTGKTVTHATGSMGAWLGGREPLHAMHGPWQAMLEPRSGQHFFPIVLRNETLFVREASLWGIATSLRFAQSRVLLGATHENLIRVDGEGVVVLMGGPGIHRFSLGMDSHCHIDNAALLAWKGALFPRALFEKQRSALISMRLAISLVGQGELYCA